LEYSFHKFEQVIPFLLVSVVKGEIKTSIKHSPDVTILIPQRHPTLTTGRHNL